MIQDCYRILGVPETAGAAEIKRAFREKAKLLHPDTAAHTRKKDRNARDEKANAAAMRELLEAYRTLSDPARRSQFDAGYARFRSAAGGGDGFDYRAWLLARTDNESRAKLIFFDLLHDLEDEAVAEYLERLDAPGGFSLLKYFGREDFMDCGFILAEELALRDKLYEAFLLLADVVSEEYKKPYFRHFFPDALDFVRSVLRRLTPDNLPDELALDCFEYALELRLGGKDDAFVLRRMAACYSRIGDAYTAAVCEAEAKKLAAAEQAGKKAARMYSETL